MFEYIRADIRRLADEERHPMRKAAVVFFNLGLQAVILYRLSSWFYRHRLKPLAGALTYWNALFTGAQISGQAIIGKGLVIYHPHGTVIGPTTVIGDNCTLTQSNLIGQLEGGGDRPTIGDHFYAFLAGFYFRFRLPQHCGMSPINCGRQKPHPRLQPHTSRNLEKIRAQSMNSRSNLTVRIAFC